MIKTKAGITEAEGTLNEILADLTMIITALRKGEIPKFLINKAIERGFKDYEKEKEEDKTDESKDFRKLLRNLGLED